MSTQSSTGVNTQTDTAVWDVIQKDLIELLGLSHLSEAEQNAYRKTAEETITNNVFTRLTNELDEMGLLPEFEKVAADETATISFLAEQGISLDDTFLEETYLYKAKMKTVADVLSAGIDVTPKN